MKRFDDIVIGAGQAGPSLAVRLANSGRKVAIVERHLVGGTCVNTGCTPTKTLIATAKVAEMARRAGEFGIDIGSDVTIDLSKAMVRMTAISSDSRTGLESWLAGTEGCTLLRGHARFDSAQVISVDGERYEAERFFLNVGGRATVPDLPGIHDIPFLTNSSILRLDELPRHLVVVGGSYVGLEFAQMFRRFGSAVTVVEKGPRLIGREDADVSDCVRALVEREGIAVRTDAECIRFRRGDEAVVVGVDCADGSPEVEGSHVLLAMGRRPNTDDLGLEKAGVELDSRGNVVVDDHLRSSAPHIFAMGDCNGRGAFTHTAYNDYEIVAENLLDGGNRKLTDRITAYALYTDPPLGRAGMTDTEIRRLGRPALTAMRPMTKVGRAVEKGEAFGFMKITVDAEKGTILGAAIIGPGGDEAIHAVLDMMYAGASVETLRRAVHIHPTVAELLPTIAGELTPLL